ncbi:MAG: thioredoxin family protein [Spirochaetes bacterium]|nr:thioredoxin family protein [Spirochaetota bacterium]
MSETPSTMVPLGSKAPYFILPDVVSGKDLSLNDISSNTATVIMFICNHCPFVKHVQKELTGLSNEYIAKGISFAAINSNDVENYPQDSPRRMKETAETQGFTFPYLYDETQETAKAYHAACTPDFYIYDKDMKLVYRGQMDDSRPGNGKPVTGLDIRNALDAVINGNTPDSNQKPSIGCNIKWK